MRRFKERDRSLLVFFGRRLAGPNERTFFFCILHFFFPARPPLQPTPPHQPSIHKPAPPLFTCRLTHSPSHPTMLDARTLTSTPHGACTVSMLTLIGGVVALSALARLLRGIWVYFLRPGKDLKKLGEWRRERARWRRARCGPLRRDEKRPRRRPVFFFFLARALLASRRAHGPIPPLPLSLNPNQNQVPGRSSRVPRTALAGRTRTCWPRRVRGPERKSQSRAPTASLLFFFPPFFPSPHHRPTLSLYTSISTPSRPQHPAHLPHGVQAQGRCRRDRRQVRGRHRHAGHRLWGVPPSGLGTPRHRRGRAPGRGCPRQQRRPVVRPCRVL